MPCDAFLGNISLAKRHFGVTSELCRHSLYSISRLTVPKKSFNDHSKDPDRSTRVGIRIDHRRRSRCLWHGHLYETGQEPTRCAYLYDFGEASKYAEMAAISTILDPVELNYEETAFGPAYTPFRWTDTRVSGCEEARAFLLNER